MSHPIIVILVVVISLYLYYVFQRWQRNQPQAVVQKTMKRVAIYIVIALLIFLTVTGRLHWLFALIASIASALIPLIRRYLPLLIRYLPFLANLYRQAQAAKSTGSPSQGRQSKVSTDYVRMVLDHDTGDIHGEVLKGAFQGKLLADLSQEQLLMLLHECNEHDTDAVPLLEAFMDRTFGSEWRSQYSDNNGERGSNNFNTGKMTEEEAFEILGLKPGVSPQEIISAHRRLIAKLHPDRGGSNYLAAKINQAKDFLLNQR